jgi:hypothetical protein
MKAGQITAKLRDAVPVCFFEYGEERTRYRNIDIPDSLKELDILDFGFDVIPEGKITFRLHFEDGVLPAEFPPIREKLTRAEMKAAKAGAVHTADLAEAAAEVIAVVTGEDVTAEAANEPAEEIPEIPVIPEFRFNVTGDRRKALVAVIGEHTGEKPIYKAAPSFAFVIGTYTVDKTGTLIGEASTELLGAIAEQGFIAENEAE